MNRNLDTYNLAEQRNKLSHFTVQGFDLNGIIHVGANDGEEIHNYIRMGFDYIIGFEPMDGVFEKLQQDCFRWPSEIGISPKQLVVYKTALHDVNEMHDFYVCVGDGKGSTLMDIGYEEQKSVEWMDGLPMFIDHIKIQTQTFYDWYNEELEIIDLNNYDTLLLDTQGNEFQILNGMGDLLQEFKYLCIELSTVPMYKGEAPADVVSAWLETKGFVQDSPLYEHNDAFFIRSDIKSHSDRVYLGRA